METTCTPWCTTRHTTTPERHCFTERAVIDRDGDTFTFTLERFADSVEIAAPEIRVADYPLTLTQAVALADELLGLVDLARGCGVAAA